jgi:hypothetical protein
MHRHKFIPFPNSYNLYCEECGMAPGVSSVPQSEVQSTPIGIEAFEEEDNSDNLSEMEAELYRTLQDTGITYPTRPEPMTEPDDEEYEGIIY